MVRELAISLYLLVFRVVFNICKLFPLKDKTVFVMSFGDDIIPVVKELKRKTDEDVVILKTSRSDTEISDVKVISFNLWNHIAFIYHLATSKTIFIDNYFGFLAATNFKDNVKCIQLWHANGAVKRFGLKDPSNEFRPPNFIKRINKVYSRFDYVIVGSEKMANIFKQSFGVEDDAILRLGSPRTDTYYNDSQHNLSGDTGKGVILYAPTFRNGELNKASVELDINKMSKHLSDEYVLFIRFHPSIRYTFANDQSDFVKDVSRYPHISDLLKMADILITDYSSLPFEFSLLSKPMIFYAYDLDSYKEERGFWEDYRELIPGDISTSTDELINIIKSDSFNMDKVKKFSREWNEYSDGDSARRVVNYFYG